MWPLALAAELGPRGWLHLGPPPVAASEEGPAPERVRFDRACRVIVERVDLDAGPGHRDVRLGRVWDGTWRWVDDAVVRDGLVYRPGQRPAPARGVEVDGEGRVTAWLAGGRRVEVLREAGAFVGLRSGTAEVRLAGDHARAQDGRTVLYRRDEGRLVGFVDEHGAASSYAYDGDALSLLGRADGANLAFEAGAGRGSVRGSEGTWGCAASGDTTSVTGPGEARWTVTATRAEGLERVDVRDPSGAEVRSWWGPDGLVGWIDPRGRRGSLVREGGRVVQVGDDARLSWGEAGLEGVDVGRGAWRYAGDARGRIDAVHDPAGRTLRVTRGPDGRLRAWERGLERWAWLRDAEGLLTGWEGPGGGEGRIARDPLGRVVGVVGPGGAAWRLRRGPDGRVDALVTPGGGTWSLGRDRLGRVEEVRDPEGGRLRWRRRTDGRLARLDGGGAWDFLRSASGALSALRDPLGGRWGYERGADGAPDAVRWPDGTRWALRTDPAGDLVAVSGPSGAVDVTRDERGRPTGAGELRWDWHGGLAAVHAPGVELAFEHDGAGLLAAVSAGAERWTLSRGADGRVSAVAGPGAVVLERDLAGRVVRLRGAEDVRLVRDLAGRVTGLDLGTAAFAMARDAGGNLLRLTAPWGRLGSDRDDAGRVTLLRFPDGALARPRPVMDGTTWEVRDSAGVSLGELAEQYDALGEVRARRTGLGDVRLARDPVGALAVEEWDGGAWSYTRQAVEGPDLRVTWDREGGEGTTPAGPLGWSRGEDGGIVHVGGERVTRDAAGRLTRWRGSSLSWSALGRLQAVAGRPASGWELAGDGELRATGATLPEARVCATGWSLLGLDGRSLYGPDIGASATGWPVDDPCAGPLATEGLELGRVGGRLRWSGESVGPEAAWPWEVTPLQVESPFPEPDGASRPGWDPGGWASRSPWGDPLALLLAGGVIDDPHGELGVVDALAGGVAARPGPGLPWLPASLQEPTPAAVVWAPVPEEDGWTLLLLALATGGRERFRASTLPGWLLAAEVAQELDAGWPGGPEARLLRGMGLAPGAAGDR